MRIVYITIEQNYSDLPQDDKRATEMFFLDRILTWFGGNTNIMNLVWVILAFQINNIVLSVYFKINARPIFTQ